MGNWGAGSSGTDASGRYTVPALASFQGPIADDEFDLERARTEEDRQLARNGRASKLWRTLRIASKSRFGLLDCIEDGHNLGALFATTADGEGEGEGEGGVEGGDGVGDDGGADVAEPLEV